MKVAIILVVSMVLVPLAFAEEEGIVPIFCGNDYRALPGEGATFDAYAAALAQIIENETSLKLRPVLVHSLGEFTEYLAYPQTYAGIISLFEAKGDMPVPTVPIPPDIQLAIQDLFGRGVGLIGINAVAFFSNLSTSVFPVFANSTSPGKLGISGGKLLMGHEYVLAAPNHPIAAGLPEKMFFSDVELYWSDVEAPQGMVAQVPSPEHGKLTVVYRTKVSGSSYEDEMAPAVITYENGGRSVTFPAFGLTERGGPDDYSSVVYDHSFQKLLTNSLKWVAEKGKETSQKRLEDSKSRIDSMESDKAALKEEATGWKKRKSQGRMIRLAVLTALGIVAIVVVYRITFLSNEE